MLFGEGKFRISTSRSLYHSHLSWLIIIGFKYALGSVRSSFVFGLGLRGGEITTHLF
jgi:hypothetical protein